MAAGLSATRGEREPFVLLAGVVIALILSGIGPADRVTWVLEILPVLVATPLLCVTARRFPLTPLSYRLIAAHALVLIVGAHYTYAKVPAGFWAQDVLGLSRNPYDRLGHFAQGFVPAIVAREVLLRVTPLRRGGWLFFLVDCVCLAISAAYELLEWFAATIGGSAADAFLGTQGDAWDAQWDMLLALGGATAAQLALGRVHDRAVGRLLPAGHPA